MEGSSKQVPPWVVSGIICFLVGVLVAITGSKMLGYYDRPIPDNPPPEMGAGPAFGGGKGGIGGKDGKGGVPGGKADKGDKGNGEKDNKGDKGRGDAPPGGEKET